MASTPSQPGNSPGAPEQGTPSSGGSKGIISSVSRAASSVALRGRSATLNALHIGRGQNRTESSASPLPPGNVKGETASGHHPFGSLSGISSTATSALRGLASGVHLGAGGNGAGGVGGSGSTTNSEVGLGSGRLSHELPSIRKGYLLMLTKPGQTWSGTAGGGGGVGVEAGSGEWSERFFYLLGHFLRYKKQSRNLTSVNLKQTDHVEFNLQSAIVETLEDAQEREGVEGASVSSHPRRKHAFRLVPTPASEEKPSPASPTALSTTSFGEARTSRSSTTPCEAALAKDAAEAEERNSRGSWSQASACNGGGKPPQQVWVLAATSEKERAMWMQAIREAISLGRELLSCGEAGCEPGPLFALARRMSEELEVRDRHHRLRFYRSCFLGEDAVSWLQSECGPCSVEEALWRGNKMVAAGLIYHCTYGHSLENSRLFYKFANSVVSASGGSRVSLSRQTSGERIGAKGSRFGAKGVGSGGGLTDGNRPYRSTNDLTGIVSRSSGEHNYDHHRYFGGAGERGSNGEGGGSSDASSEDSGSVVSVDNSGSAVCRGEAGPSSAMEGEGRGVGSGVVSLSKSVVAATAAAASSDGRSGFRESSGGHAGEKKATTRRIARELEELKLACAEMERSQMRTERQMQAFATGLLACVETSMDGALASTAAALALAAFGLALQAVHLDGSGRPAAVAAAGAAAAGEEDGDLAGGTPFALRILQAMLIALVAIALRSYANGREAVGRAIEATKGLCCGGMMPSSGFDQGWGGGSGGAMGKAAAADGFAVPLLHPGQAKELFRTTFGNGTRSRSGTESTPPAGSLNILSRVASNKAPALPPQLADPPQLAERSRGGPMSSDSCPPPLPELSSDVMSRDSSSVAVAGADSAARVSASVAVREGAAGIEARGTDKDKGGGVVDGGGGVAAAGGVGGERPELASLPPEKEWPHHPIFVRLSPSVGDQVRLDGHEPNSSIPVNSDDIAVPFETPLFKGRLLVRVAGLPGDGAQDYFRGKKRLMQCAVQGEFKKELPFDRVYTGQAYDRPFTQLPAKWLIRSAFSLIRRLSPALREDITGERPYMVSPLAATAQSMRAEAPGDEVAIVGDLGEETGLLGESFMDSRVPSSARKKFFNNPRNLKAYSFKPGVVYTFDFYQHLYNAVTFELDLGFRKVKLADYLNHQPAQARANNKFGSR
ncbi:conserved unknown protein [Ectocarpus siliculosus]|uniref:PH domain-containing protein n=1 Tax=Ectocarpus siliculosus TaxID=2880 RepID=D8LTP0_ECTSI|nr:conserved unknown protein [Ectocarpus siliculosus]|eukprot:CBN73937.1 conserved unknown protein [Ectocarpus siliculosus]